MAEEAAQPQTPENVVRILCLGDVVGRPGRQILKDALPTLRKKLALDLIIANGENSAGGIGITPETFREITGAGVDIVTTGNHVWKHREVYPLLDKEPRLLRPANYPTTAPGRGYCLHTLPGGTRVLVINLLGRVYMEPVNCPFVEAERILHQFGAQAAHSDTGDRGDTQATPFICVVDFHAEASSEKRGMAHFLDGRATAVLGTHTHVQTADAFILDGGTATLTDLGMCGVERNSVLGMKKEPVLERFTTGLPFPFKPASGAPTLNGALIEAEKTTGRALSIRVVRGSLEEMLR